ncbi:hypothetical protein [uncultured Roseobacter sp.]|uniref:hypothetical protein n=1 Tax=uncultured Roseobacter sp. TaxID=114847 RepID=UPI00260B68E9|nr:hypothetical protein [uncultured Roseobacter sp.]
MTKQDRATLKSFFRSGALPTATEYRDLIDSTVNQVDDGFAKTDADGLRLNSVGSSLRVLSLYQGLGTPKPSWVLEHGDALGALHFRPDLGKSALEFDGGAAPGTDTSGDPAIAGLSITRDGRVGVAREAPDWRLDVAGVARMQGRIGVASHKIPYVKADGKWHDITQAMTGCQCFEITAGTGGDPRKGRYSMMHAIAMNAFHPRNPILNWLFRRRSIKTQTAMYGSYADRLRLRWVADEQQHHFRLQLRTNANFGEGKVVRYYLTQLWFDSLMTGAREGADRDAGAL